MFFTQRDVLLLVVGRHFDAFFSETKLALARHFLVFVRA